jgi:hypothetical protein
MLLFGERRLLLQRFNDGACGAGGQGRQFADRLRLRLSAALTLAVLAAGSAQDSWAGPPERGERSPEAAGVPQLLVERPEVDLGDLPKGSSSVASFEMRNAGAADLRIVDVLPSCGCTVVSFDRVIPPGEVGQLTATLYTESLDGEVAKGITVVTNDPAQTRVQLLIRAAVVTAVRVLPDIPIVLRNDDGSRTVRRLIRRSATSGHGFFNITGLRASVPWLKPTARKVREKEPVSVDIPAARVGDWIVELRLDREAPYGSSGQQLQFATGLDRQPRVFLAVRAEVATPVQLPVDRLLLPESEGLAKDTLAFLLREGLDPKDLRLDARPDGLEVELRPGTGRSFEARVKWIGGPLEGGRLIFRIADEVYEIPVALASAG